MKIRRLPETDLARIAPLPAEQKRRALEQLKLGFPPFSYEPVRRSWPDILNVQPGLFGYAEPTAWPHIEQAIRKLSRSNKEFDFNIEVAASLHASAASCGWRAKSYDIYPLALGVTGIKVEFWLQLVIVVDDKPLIPFFEPRRSSLRLSEAGRRFVFSSMHERIRAPDPEMSHVQLGIFQFDQSKSGGRVLRLHTDSGVALYSYDELDQMVSETYAIWSDVLEGREEESRRKASGKRGTLL